MFTGFICDAKYMLCILTIMAGYIICITRCATAASTFRAESVVKICERRKYLGRWMMIWRWVGWVLLCCSLLAMATLAFLCVRITKRMKNRANRFYCALVFAEYECLGGWRMGAGGDDERRRARTRLLEKRALSQTTNQSYLWKKPTTRTRIWKEWAKQAKECERNHFGVIQSLWSCNSYIFFFVCFVSTIKPNIAGAKSLTPLRRRDAAVLLARSFAGGHWHKHSNGRSIEV